MVNFLIDTNIKQRIIDLIRVNNENLKSKHLELSVSIGYAMLENKNDTIEYLMKKADALMYADKARKHSSI
ncbi:GGDEF domain-containing protein [Desulfitobacterium sp. AusDCA]